MVLTVAAIGIFAVQISSHAREWVVDALKQEFKCDVELANFNVTIFPRLQVEGEGLVLQFHGRADLPPLISVVRFSMQASYLDALRYPRHVQSVHLEGLQINIPPRGERNGDDKASAERSMQNLHSVFFNEIISENATLKILTRKPGKDSLAFNIEKVHLHSVGSEGELVFDATLTNPIPPGSIVSTGTFGPWNRETPSLTPVSGKYTFENVNMGVFHGISGTLSSKGSYKGVMEEIQVEGTTDIPDFQVDRAHHRLDLSTKFQATVDGTNGDTYLHPVEAHFGKTSVTAVGSMEGSAGKKGKTVKLDVRMEQARIEDILLLAVKEPPPMTGVVRVNTKFTLLPGVKDILDRLQMNGSIALDSGHFTSSTEQQMVDNMSKRSLGTPKEVQAPGVTFSKDDVVSTMSSKFRIENGILTLSGLKFHIPGADLDLNGTYKLEQEMLDMHGHAAMKAKVSETTTGTKSFFLKFADPFFSKRGKGSVVPIKITGTLQNPKYGLDSGNKNAPGK